MKRWGVLAMAVVVLAAAGLCLRWRAHYQPLTIGAEAVGFVDRISGRTLHPGGTGMGVTSISSEFHDVEDDQQDDARRHVAADYLDGQHVTFAYALHNGGRVSVVITGIDAPPKYALLATIDIEVGTRRFHPFTLDAGKTIDVTIRQRLHACEWNEPGSTNGYEGFGLSYRVLGLHRAVSIPTPMRVDFKVPADYACPRVHRA